LEQMRQKMKQMAQPEAAEKIVAEIEDILNEKHVWPANT